MKTLKYLSIAEQLRKNIIQGIYVDKLPTENELVELYSVSKITIKRAISILESEGLVYKVQGSGIYVNSTNSSILTSNYKTHMRGFSEEHEGLDFVTSIYKFKIINCPEHICKFLNLTIDDEVYEIYRTRTRYDITERYEQTYISVKLIPGLTKEICQASIYSYIRNTLNLEIKKSNDYFFANKSTDLDNMLLDTNVDEVVIALEQIAFLSDNSIFQYSITKYKYDFFDYKTITHFDEDSFE